MSNSDKRSSLLGAKGFVTLAMPMNNKREPNGFISNKHQVQKA